MTKSPLKIEDKLHYCILHGWDCFFENRGFTDLDIVIAPSDLLPLEKCLQSQGGIVQLLQHESTSYCFCVLVRSNERRQCVPVDTATDYRLRGRIFFAAEELLEGRMQRNGFWVAAPTAEFAYLLVKKIFKGAFEEHQRNRLEALRQEIGGDAFVVGRRLLGQEWGEKLMEWVGRSDWNTIKKNIRPLKHRLRQEVLAKDPLNPLRYWIPDLGRRFLRWCYPTGLFVAVLGPDGSGKTLLIRSLGDSLAGVFSHVQTEHFRPHIFDRNFLRGSVAEPHGKKAHPLWFSFLKTLYYWGDYLLGYATEVRLKLVSSTLMIFDRYYDDLLIDPRRYRFQSVTCFLRFFHKLIPQPALTLVLDVPAEEIAKRKLEVQPSEVQRQRREYFRLAMASPRAMVIDGSQDEGSVAVQSRDLIFDYLARRYVERRHVWFRDEMKEGREWLLKTARLEFPEKQALEGTKAASFGIISLSRDRKYLIPLRAGIPLSKSLAVFNAQTLKARVMKSFLGIGLRTGAAKIFLPKTYIEKSGLPEYIEKVLGKQGLDFCVSLGTPSLQRKPVFRFFSSNGQDVFYAKVGWNQETKALVENEARVLSELKPGSFDIPVVLHNGTWDGRSVIITSAAPKRVKTAPRAMCGQYEEILKELSGMNRKESTLEESVFWKDLSAKVRNVSNAYYRHLLDGGMHKAISITGNRKILFHFSHGDFAPWNMYSFNDRLFIYDWECSSPERPAGYDRFHLLVQTASRLGKRSPYETDKGISKHDRACALLYLLDKLAAGSEDENELFSHNAFLAKLIQIFLEKEGV